MEKKVIVIAVAIVIAFLLGFYFGTAFVVERVIDVASRFVVINDSAIMQALFQYHNNIGGCYPSIFENASVFFDTGNEELS